jgi:hypothetical protein
MRLDTIRKIAPIPAPAKLNRLKKKRIGMPSTQKALGRATGVKM